MNWAERIDEAHRMVRKFMGTRYEAAAMAYLTEQVRLCRQSQEASRR